MTVQEIVGELRRYKPCSKASVYNYMRIIGIKPTGKIRQRPQHYPANTAEQIVEELGLDGVAGMMVLRPLMPKNRPQTPKAKMPKARAA
jgi:hypothetical protein